MILSSLKIMMHIHMAFLAKKVYERSSFFCNRMEIVYFSQKVVLQLTNAVYSDRNFYVMRVYAYFKLLF